MICLGIETSCDETSVAVWSQENLLKEITHTQISMHSVFGGVVPELASREHLRKLDTLISLLQKELGSDLFSRLDLIAVTRGPGLLGALLVGIAYAKSLALGLEIPIIGVNHLHAHLLACNFSAPITYPALGVLVSGGHTHIYQMDSAHSFILLGKTLDDAAGEAFDKIGKILNLPYPGGKYIDLLGQRGTANSKIFTKPYLNNDNCDFSFSGLKTAVYNFIQKNEIPALNYENLDLEAVPQQVRDLCATVNEVIVETIVEKTRRALALCSKTRTICLAGGVAANTLLRQRVDNFAQTRNINFLAPPQNYCGDNAAMIAYTGIQLARCNQSSALDFEAIPRGQLFPDDYISKPLS
jgi:N6-L-threonylcarbamoyladenine synthase